MSLISVSKFKPYGQKCPPPQVIVAEDPSKVCSNVVADGQLFASHLCVNASVVPTPSVCAISCRAVRSVMNARSEPKRILPLKLPSAVATPVLYSTVRVFVAWEPFASCRAMAASMADLILAYASAWSVVGFAACVIVYVIVAEADDPKAATNNKVDSCIFTWFLDFDRRG